MKRITAIIAVFALALTARAQNLNPTVEVTNVYEGAVTLPDKPTAPMTVPDSVTVFNLDFDYSTFERPYMGAYDFAPYLIALKPSPSASSPRKLFIKAGAGYYLRPEAEIVWNPCIKGDFHPGVYASLDSFFGSYYDIRKNNGGLVPQGSFKGFDAAVKAGTNGAWFLPRAVFSYDVHYGGIFTKDTLGVRPVNMVDGSVRLRSSDVRDRRFIYDASIAYRFTKDSVGYRPNALMEHRFIFDSTFGYDLTDEHRFTIDTDVNVSDIEGRYEGYGFIIRFVPKYRLERGRWHLDAGVALSIPVGSGRNDDAAHLYRSRGYQVVYPDVFIGFEAIRERMLVYARVKGGETLNSFSDIVLANHFFSKSYGHEGALVDFSAERINAAIGLRGNIGARFHYDLFGGYAAVKNDFLYGTAGPSVVYKDHNLWYATLLAGWDSTHCRVDGGLYFRKTNLDRKEADAFAPAVFSGSLKAEYVYKSRLAVGIDCAWATRMHSYGAERYTVPGWFDLGIIADFAITRKFSLWARSGNLIGMNIQKVPFYAEKGRWGTLGIKFIL